MALRFWIIKEPSSFKPRINRNLQKSFLSLFISVYFNKQITSSITLVLGTRTFTRSFQFCRWKSVGLVNEKCPKEQV